MNQIISTALCLLTAISVADCGPSTSSTPEPNTNMPNDSRAHALLQHQRENFPRILTELNSKGKKTSHWIWWVFPTEVPGASEPEPKSSVDMKNIEDVLANANMSAWTEIVEKIASLLEKNPMPQKNQPNPSIIPTIDHGRIGHAMNFWLDKAKGKLTAHPQFLQALQRLQAYRWK